MHSGDNIFGYLSGSKETGHVSSHDLRSDPQWHSLLLPDSLVKKVGERQILHDTVRIPNRKHNNSSPAHCPHAAVKQCFNTIYHSSTLTLTLTSAFTLPHPPPLTLTLNCSSSCEQSSSCLKSSPHFTITDNSPENWSQGQLPRTQIVT